jgi:HlyD family secretion protein
MSRKTVVTAAVVLAALAAGAAAYGWWGARNAAPSYRFATVERGGVTSVVSATGTLNPVVSVQVGSQVSGQIREIFVDFNSQVKRGQVIAQIDPDSFALRVSQAMADLEAARANVLTQRANVAALQAQVSRARVELAEAQRDYERNRSLYERNFISTAVLDRSKAALDASRETLRSAEAQLAVGQSQVRNVEALVKQREAQLAQAKVDLERTTIRAPVDGVVVKKSVEPGQTVAASLQAPELFVIAQDLREMQVETSIDEAEVGRVRVGQPATFTVDSFPGRTFRGTVSQVRKAAQVVQNVVTYTAVIATSNPNQMLFPGMTANVRIVVDARENVLKVPNAALRFRPAGAQAGAAPRGAAEPAGATAPEAGGGGRQGGEGVRERLAKELELNAEQQAKLDAILRETRERIRGLQTEDKGERRKQAERLRADSRARIAEMLTPEQRGRYEQMETGAGRGGGRAAASGRVWVLDDRGRVQAVAVRLGLTDGTHTELLDGELQEGSRVIVGTLVASKTRPQATGGPRLAF